MNSVLSPDTSSPSTDPVAGKTVAEILGEIVWLMTQDPQGREMKVADIERLVMPAILQRRFHIQYAKVPVPMKSGMTILQPVGVDIFSEENGEVERNTLGRVDKRDSADC